MGRHFTTDCEGPISKNDNAQELSAHFIPKGEAFFALISKYDDFLADVMKKPGYKAGDTLKLILPFLMAFGADNKAIQNYSRSHILLVRGAAEALQFIRRLMPSFIISTSYTPYVEALCQLIDFPVDQVFSTEIDVDRYQLAPEERSRLRKMAMEIVELEMLLWPEYAQDIKDLPEDHQKTVRQLNRIFWEIIPKMETGRVLEEINPVGGEEKAKAVLKTLERTGHDLADVMYVGDSITDVQALDLVKENGGLAISFNGNGYAIRSSHVCCMADDARVIAVLADAFFKRGRDGGLDLVRSWGSDNVGRFPIGSDLLAWFNTLPREAYPRVELITDSNREALISASEAFRKSVRGEHIGALG